MIRVGKKFVLSDETVNSYGFKVLTNGIDLRKFLKNPIMLRNHKGEAIGFWENIKIEGNKLLAEPVFTDTTEESKKIAQQVKEGTLKAASIGIENAVFSYDSKYKDPKAENGTVLNCMIYEASIVDLPSNENAIALYDNTGGRLMHQTLIEDYITLNLFTNKNQFKMNKETLALLNLDESADATTVHNAVVKLLEQVQSATLVNNQLQDERNHNIIELAISNGKITFGQAEQYKVLLGKNFNETKKLLDTLDGKKILKKDFKLSDLIDRNVSNNENKEDAESDAPPKDKGKWTLEHYRRFAPNEIMRNTSLYNKLLEEHNNRRAI